MNLLNNFNINRQRRRFLKNQTRMFFIKELGLFWRFKISHKDFYNKALEFHNKNLMRNYIG